ncbi:hypothetical protein DMZ48_01685 [Robertkochia solimangrovi]|nr:hypothetical protein DMZ48_01685 [Robertkochia solimangrovi]
MAFGLHKYVLDLLGVSTAGLYLPAAYIINVILAAAIVTIIFIFRKRFFSQIGFFFLGGSMLKFLVFFVVFNPRYGADGQLDRLEFLSFFIPYGVCLMIETIAVSKLLNNTSEDN